MEKKVLVVRVCEIRWSEAEIEVDAAEYAAWKDNQAKPLYQPESKSDRKFRQAVSQQIRELPRDDFGDVDYSASVEVIDNDTGEHLEPFLQPSVPKWCNP